MGQVTVHVARLCTDRSKSEPLRRGLRRKARGQGGRPRELGLRPTLYMSVDAQTPRLSSGSLVGLARAGWRSTAVLTDG